MLSAVPNRNLAPQASHEPVLYMGRNATIGKNDLMMIKASGEISDVILDLKRLGGPWGSLCGDFVALGNALVSPSTQIEQYRVELISDALIPYITDLKARIFFDESRVGQIQSLVHLLLNGCYANTVHPANTLLEIDKVVADIKRQGNWWPSQLAQKLERAARKQWQPILFSNQLGLKRVGGQLIALGLVEVLGRPVMMLYPLYLISKEVMLLAKELQTKKSLNPTSLMQICKIVALLAASMQVLSILSMYSGLGYTCLMLGAAAVLIAASDDLTKAAVPTIAPILSQVDVFVQRISAMEQTALRALSNDTAHLHAQQQQHGHVPAIPVADVYRRGVSRGAVVEVIDVTADVQGEARPSVANSSAATRSSAPSTLIGEEVDAPPVVAAMPIVDLVDGDEGTGSDEGAWGTGLRHRRVDGSWTCSACTFKNFEALHRCEMCDTNR